MKQKWFYSYQKLFKEWLKAENLKSNCLTQKIGLNTVTEEYEVYPNSGGAGTYVKFTIARLTPSHISAYVEKDGKNIDLNNSPIS